MRVDKYISFRKATTVIVAGRKVGLGESNYIEVSLRKTDKFISGIFYHEYRYD